MSNVISDNGLAGFCFEPQSLMLRYSKGGFGSDTVWDEIVYNKILRFEGRYVPSDVRVTRGGKLYLTLHLERLETIPQPNSADFTPPPAAVAVNEKLVVPDGRVLMLDYLLHQEFPKYPKSIRPPGGEAVVKYRIKTDGSVTGVQLVEGTQEMGKAIEDALKEYVYRPFLVRGEPVEVEVKQEFAYHVH